jgi:hypothetical protein
MYMQLSIENIYIYICNHEFGHNSPNSIQNHNHKGEIIFHRSKTRKNTKSRGK